MSPELNRAIIKFVPDYFSWNRKRQEQYRVDTPEEDKFKIIQFLLRKLFDIYASNDDEVEEAKQEMSEARGRKTSYQMISRSDSRLGYFQMNSGLVLYCFLVYWTRNKGDCSLVLRQPK